VTKRQDSGASRRSVLKAGMVMVAGATMATTGAAIATTADAQQKMAQKMVQYIPETKKPNQMCSNCVNFVAPNACKIVDGEIHPGGWCVAWAPAPKTSS
jgi:hypothetical protein